jgi:hypothetical protein
MWWLPTIVQTLSWVARMRTPSSMNDSTTLGPLWLIRLVHTQSPNRQCLSARVPALLLRRQYPHGFPTNRHRRFSLRPTVVIAYRNLPLSLFG